MQLLMQALQPMSFTDASISSAVTLHTNSMSHGSCHLWHPWLVSLHVLSDLLIALAYFTIPVVLVYFVQHRSDLPFKGVLLLFGALITVCGIGHLMEVWTLWHPNYWTAGVFKAITALISVYTTLKLIVLLQPTQTRLIDQEKLSRLGQLVAVIAHWSGNQISFICGNLCHTISNAQGLLAILHRYLRESPDLSLALSKMIARQDFARLLARLRSSVQLGVERIQTIGTRLRGLIAASLSSMKPATLYAGIDSTLLILQHWLNKIDNAAIGVVQRYSPILSVIEYYLGQLDQVFMNLIVNAIDALEERLKNNGVMDWTNASIPTIPAFSASGKIAFSTYRKAEGTADAHSSDDAIEEHPGQAN